jgi:putative pyruvate formate lyase activating enzyme
MSAPSYIAAFHSGALRARMDEALQRLVACFLCPRKCGVNRLHDERGYCATGRRAIVCSTFAHHGEEPPVSGDNGSGIIFFSRCNMRCVYCQNHHFSQSEEGKAVSAEELARFMLDRQEEGCHNINLATPTHVMPQILEALVLAVPQGLNIPLVYNTSGYELPEAIALLDGIVDIYLPDMRYADAATAQKYSDAPDYPAHNQAGILAMHRQVGVARFNEDGTIARGLIIRHLVLPGGLSETKAILDFIAREVSQETYISLMSQYFPTFQAHEHPPLDRRLYLDEYEKAVGMMQEAGLHNGWIQEAGGLSRFNGTNIKRNT